MNSPSDAVLVSPRFFKVLFALIIVSHAFEIYENIREPGPERRTLCAKHGGTYGPDTFGIGWRCHVD